MEQTRFEPARIWPVELHVPCGAGIFTRSPVTFSRWAHLNYLVGPNASGKTTLFNAIMHAARSKWPNKVKILGTGRLGPLEKSVQPWIGDIAARLFHDDQLESIYSSLFSGTDTAHQAFQLLEKRLDLRIRVLAFLGHVFKRSISLRPTRQGLQVLGVGEGGSEYQIVDECHGLKELITILTFLYDDTFSVLGIDEPELHLHPQFQRYLLDELRSVAGSPDVKGKKLIFLVTHSPVLLDLRHLEDLSSVIVFSPGFTPQRARLDEMGEEEIRKVTQALPSFHAAQRELIFSSTPVLLEGSTDTSIVLNVATKINIALGAAGIGVAPLGGKTKLFAFRSILRLLAKPRARFVLDLDAAFDTNSLQSLDREPEVSAALAAAGAGGRTLTQEMGELIGLVRAFAAKRFSAMLSLGPLTPRSDPLTEVQMAVALSAIREELTGNPDSCRDRSEAEAIVGKFELVRSAAKAAQVLILRRGSIEAYYENSPSPLAKDFVKQEAFQRELDVIWRSANPSELEARYAEILDFIKEAGLLKTPIGDVVREPIANLVHLLQTEIAAGRVRTRKDALEASRVKAEGYWYICELTRLDINDANRFTGTLVVKPELGGATFEFNEDTRPYLIRELTTTEAVS